MNDFPRFTLPHFLAFLSTKRWTWIAKRLSGNDTGITGGHQAGVYFPKTFIQNAFSQIDRTDEENPSLTFPCSFPYNRDYNTQLRAIYYNSKPRQTGTRNEFRITCWGGSDSPVQIENNTGALFLFAVGFCTDHIEALAWVARNSGEESAIENWCGCEVDPGDFVSSVSLPIHPMDYPQEWNLTFPDGATIFHHIEQKLHPWKAGVDIDRLLMTRRDSEYRIFRGIEDSHTLPLISKGFSSVEDFVRVAKSVTNRRKTRTGHSLECNLASVFRSENILFSEQAFTEAHKKPDFLFPSISHYRDFNFPSERLYMLASKTCCKDRWRQALTEADRIRCKHLFTLQEGLSENQYDEMSSAHLRLVVPQPNIEKFPLSYRAELLTLRQFVDLQKENQKCIIAV